MGELCERRYTFAGDRGRELIGVLFSGVGGAGARGAGEVFGVWHSKHQVVEHKCICWLQRDGHPVGATRCFEPRIMRPSRGLPAVLPCIYFDADGTPETVSARGA